METLKDVIIIGAGPAGLMAARQLAINGVETLLITREMNVPGEEKVCGGFIPARALEEFNIGNFAGAFPILGVRMKFPGTEIKQVDFDEPIGYDATRADIGRALLHLIDQSIVEIRMGQCVVGCVEEKEYCIVRMKGESGIEGIPSRIVIDASGVSPVTSKNSLVRPRLTPQQLGYAVQYQMRRNDSLSFDPVIEFYYGSEFSPKGYAWIFPRGNEAAVGTGGILSQVKSNSRQTIEYLNHLLEKSPTLQLNGSIEIIKQEAALMPLAGIVKPSYSNRILLAGDAAAHCSPISGEGIYYSMVCGDLAGKVAASAIQQNEISRKFLKQYEKAWINRIGSDLKWGLWLQKRLTKQGSKSLGSQFLQDEKSCRIIAEMLIGQRSVKSSILAALPKYLKAKILG